MHLSQIGLIEMRVDLRGRYIGVAQELLHNAQIGTAFEQMGGEAVAQHMG